MVLMVLPPRWTSRVAPPCPSCKIGRESPSLLGLKFGRVAADLGSEVPRSGPFLPRSGRNHARAARAQRNFRKISYFPLGNSAKFF